MRPRRLVPRWVTAAAAASVALAALSAGTVQPWNRPSSANAAAILEGIQTEAFYDSGLSGAVTTTLACGPGIQFRGPGVTTEGPLGIAGDPGPSLVIGVEGGQGPGGNPPGPIFFEMNTGGPVDGAPGGVFSIGTGPDGQQGGLRVIGGDPGQAGAPPPGGPGPFPAANMPNPTELSDRLGQALGLSGDRVREAMRQTVGALPPPVDPLSRIASQLGVSVDQVREAFANPDCPGQISIALRASASDVTGPAQKLGVSPERLAAAMTAAAPPPPPSFDETINRLAQNLGVSSDRLRTAMEQVEGPHRLFLAVPAPPGAAPRVSLAPASAPTGAPAPTATPRR